MLSSFALSALVAFYASSSSAAAISGKATFYGGNTQGGMCSFSKYTIPNGIYGTAMSSQDWDDSEACGGCVKVTGPNGNSLTAMVVDQCPECEHGQLDLFQDAFAQLDDPSKGIIPISWEWTDCPISSPLEVQMKEGVSAYWFSAHIVNANERVSDLQVSTDGGNTWKSGITRQPYNYFEQSSGYGTSSVDIKAIGVSGKSVVIKDVPVTGGASKVASGNFQASSSSGDASTGQQGSESSSNVGSGNSQTTNSNGGQSSAQNSGKSASTVGSGNSQTTNSNGGQSSAQNSGKSASTVGSGNSQTTNSNGGQRKAQNGGNPESASQFGYGNVQAAATNGDEGRKQAGGSCPRRR